MRRWRGAASSKGRALTPAQLFVLDTLIVVVAILITLVLTRSLWLPASNDPKLYENYAYQFWNAHPLFHSFPREYPPLTVLVFSLALGPGPVGVFAWEDWMVVVFLVGWCLFYRISGRRAAWRYAVLVLALQNLALTRYDLIPGLVCVGALWAAQRRSWRLAYLLLAVGTLLKLYPIFLVPTVLIEQWRVVGGGGLPEWSRASLQRLRPLLVGLAIWCGAVCVGVLIPFVLDPGSLNAILGYQSGRPIQVESTVATIVWLGTLVGVPADLVYSFGSWGFAGPLATALSPVATGLLGVGMLVVYWQVWRRHLPLAQAFLFCLGMVLLTDKVFSAQYMLWIVPIAAEAGTDFWLWLVAALLTLIDYPIFSAVQNTLFDPATRWIAMIDLALRNGLVAWGTIRALGRTTAEATTPASEPSSRDAQAKADVSGTFSG